MACLAGLIVLLSASGTARQASTQEPHSVSEIVLDGTLTRANRGTYMLRDFNVPPDVKRIDVSFSYTGTREEGTELEIGIFDPEKFRGTSRFSKKAFFITAHRATPSYFPGAIVPGTWQILLGLPSIREEVTSQVQGDGAAAFGADRRRAVGRTAARRRAAGSGLVQGRPAWPHDAQRWVRVP